MCSDMDNEKVTVTLDQRLQEIRILKPGQPIEFLKIEGEYDGRVGQ
jgi:hypothetical protein